MLNNYLAIKKAVPVSGQQSKYNIQYNSAITKVMFWLFQFSVFFIEVWYLVILTQHHCLLTISRTQQHATKVYLSRKMNDMFY